MNVPENNTGYLIFFFTNHEKEYQLMTFVSE